MSAQVNRLTRRLKQKKKKSHRFRSRFEQQVALSLKSEGVAFAYETMKLSYVRRCIYTPDFILPNGVIIEAKGRWVGSDRTKHIKVREEHPELDIRFCFQNAFNKITTKSKTTYAEWCNKHGFKWCHKRIPKEWMI